MNTSKEIEEDIQTKNEEKNTKQLSNQQIEKLFTSLKTKEVDQEDFFIFLQKVVHHIHDIVRKEKMDNEYIDNKMGNVSAREILSAGKTLYMNPCLDYVLVTIEALKRIGIKDIYFVVNELHCPGNWYKLHFGIEIIHDGEKYYIDYRSKNDVYLGKDSFSSKYEEKWEHMVNTIRIDADNIETDDTISSLMDKKLIQFRFFNPKTLDIIKAKLKNDNTEQERQEWFVAQVKHIHKPEIFIENME